MKDEHQEAIKTIASMIKLLFPHKVELQVSIKTSGTPEKFVMHATSHQYHQAEGPQRGLQEAVEDWERNSRQSLKEQLLTQSLHP